MWKWYFDVDGMYEVLSVHIYTPEYTGQIKANYHEEDEYQTILRRLVPYIKDKKYSAYDDSWKNRIYMHDVEDTYKLDRQTFKRAIPEEFI